MANQIIPGRDDSTTIVTDSYAVFGELQAGPPIPVEDSAKWQAAELDEPAVCRRYSVTPDVLTDGKLDTTFRSHPGRPRSRDGTCAAPSSTTFLPLECSTDGTSLSLDLATHVGKRAR